MASLAIGNQIVAQLKTDLVGLTVANGYSQTVKTVRRENPNIADVESDPKPAVYLWSGPQPKFITTMGQSENRLELNVVCLAETHGNQESVGREFLADVETLLTTANARTIASATVDILPEGDQVLIGNTDRSLAGGHIQFQVVYRTVLGDPRTAG